MIFMPAQVEIKTAIVTLTITKEVKLNPYDYGTDSAEDMLKIEMQYAENQTDDWMSAGNISVLVDGKIKKEELL
jgi:hypothetical protein